MIISSFTLNIHVFTSKTQKSSKIGLDTWLLGKARKNEFLKTLNLKKAQNIRVWNLKLEYFEFEDQVLSQVEFWVLGSNSKKIKSKNQKIRVYSSYIILIPVMHLLTLV